MIDVCQQDTQRMAARALFESIDLVDSATAVQITGQ
jgi:hypothetical protein